MKRAEKRKRARKFNVCKKLCQLNRVATLFSIQYHEQSFQRQYISDIYSTKIALILDKAWNESNNYYAEISSIFPSTKSKYQQLYWQKYKNAKIDINVFTQSTGEMIQRKLQNISKQIEIEIKEIISINQKIEKYHNSSYESRIFDGFVENLNALVKIQKQRYITEKNKVFANYNSKVSILNNESELRIQKMKSENEVQTDSIKSIFFKKFENNIFYIQFIKDFLIHFRNRFKSTQFSVKGIGDNFLESKNSTENTIKITKKQIFKEIDIIKNLQKKDNFEKKEILLIIDEITINNDKNIISIDSIKQELNIKMNDYKKAEDALKSELYKIRQKLENNYQFIELSQKGRLSNSEIFFSDIKKHQENEINAYNEKYTQIEANANNKVKKIEKEIKDFIEYKIKIEQNLQNQLITIKATNSNSIISINKEFDKNKELLNHEFHQKKGAIQKKANQLKYDLQNLINEKDSSLARFQSYINKFEIEEKREIENIINISKFSVSELQTELTNELNKLFQKSNEDIQKIQNECQKKTNEKLKQIEFLHNQKILQTQFNLENSCTNSDKIYLKEIDEKYSKIYEKYKNELNSILPPSNNNALACLNIEFSGLSKELKDKIESIDEDRQKLNDSYVLTMKSEEERHLNRIEEQEEMMDILSQIEKVRKEKIIKIHQLKKQQNDPLSEIQSEFERKLDLIELHFLNQKTLIIKQIESYRNELIRQKEILTNSIAELKKSHEIKIKPLQTKYSQILRKQRALITHSPNSSAIPFEELVLKKMRQHKEKVKKLREAINGVQKAQQICEDEFERKLFITKQKHKKNFESNEHKLNEEIQSLIQKRDELKESPSLVKSQNNSSSLLLCKSSDEERIAYLKKRLNMVNQQLSAVLAEYKQYKDFCDPQGNVINTSLGGSQNVAVLQLTSFTSPRNSKA